MGYLETLALLASLCERAMRLGKTIINVLPRKLTSRERDILLGATDGCYMLLDFGRLAILGSKTSQFGDPDHPMEVALYLDAFERLCRRGLVRHIRDNHFQLTGRGYHAAQRLRKTNQGK